jgi:hypothetical protein
MREQDDRHDEQNPELPVPDNKADMRRRLRCAAFLTHHDMRVQKLPLCD